METGCIYVIRNDINEKAYVGKTIRSVSRRLREHRSRLYNGDSRPFYQQLIADNVTNISLEVLEDNIPVKILDDRETH